MLNLTNPRENYAFGADLLDQAAALLNERGWCQGMYMDEAGRLCAMGALGEARAKMKSPINEHTYAVSILADWLKTEGHPQCLCGQTACHRNAIAVWNDNACTEVTEVVYGLQKAAISARERVA